MTLRPGLSIPPSIQPDAGLLTRLAGLLMNIEDLAPDATGVLQFGAGGLVLVESRQVCWAIANGMKDRLGKLLRQQRSPPLPVNLLDTVLRECRDGGASLGEALLAAGHVTEAGLREAIFSHTVEALAQIARGPADKPRFVPHTRMGFGARFVFTNAELLAAVGARSDRARAVVARRELGRKLLPDTSGVGFLRESCGPVLIAVHGDDHPCVPELMEVCHWSACLFDVSSVVGEGVQLAACTAPGSSAVVTWIWGGTHYVALCGSRAASALLMARLGESLERRAEVTQ